MGWCTGCGTKPLPSPHSSAPALAPFQPQQPDLGTRGQARFRVSTAPCTPLGRSQGTENPFPCTNMKVFPWKMGARTTFNSGPPGRKGPRAALGVRARWQSCFSIFCQGLPQPRDLGTSREIKKTNKSSLFGARAPGGSAGLAQHGHGGHRGGHRECVHTRVCGLARPAPGPQSLFHTHQPHRRLQDPVPSPYPHSPASISLIPALAQGRCGWGGGDTDPWPPP